MSPQVVIRVEDGRWVVGWTTDGRDFTPAASFVELDRAIAFANQLDAPTSRSGGNAVATIEGVAAMGASPPDRGAGSSPDVSSGSRRHSPPTAATD